MNIWLLITIWHIYATLIIYLFSFLFKNSSLYDPFWSVAPVPIVFYLTLNSNNSLEILLLVLIPIILWSIRLTHNWIISWDGFMHEDFRYVNLKNTNKIQAELNNLFGIHLVPTLIVNLSLFPVSFVLINKIDVNIYLYLASIFTFIAVILETISDKQMRDFKQDNSNSSKTMKYGLWKFSRHPNYLGESLFWFGIYFMGLSSGIMPLWTILCPTVMLFLFIFISCPMMDQRSLNNRSDYRDYMNKTSQLFLWPPKK
ncbi:MAG: hypothetical protein CMD46_03245 [Gammaproteobacteria bacterium]|nr:hypothetical protein [Gammaproteobacteria bacterium]